MLAVDTSFIEKTFKERLETAFCTLEAYIKTRYDLYSDGYTLEDEEVVVGLSMIMFNYKTEIYDGEVLDALEKTNAYKEDSRLREMRLNYTVE